MARFVIVPDKLSSRCIVNGIPRMEVPNNLRAEGREEKMQEVRNDE